MEIKGEKALKDWYKSNPLPPVILLYGDNTFHIEKHRNTLISLGASINPQFNLYRVDGSKKVDVSALENAAYTMPFMVDKKMIVVDDLVFAGHNDVVDALMEIIKDKLSTCTILITVTSTTLNLKEKRERSYKLWKAANEIGTVAELNNLNRKELGVFVGNLAIKLGSHMETTAGQLLADYCGCDMLRMTHETEKLAHYTKNVTIEEVKLLVEPVIETKIFDYAQNVVNKNADGSLKIIDDLIYSQENPVSILNIISMSFTDMYRAKVSQSQRLPQREIADKLGYYGGKAYRLTKAGELATKLDKKQIAEILSILAQADKDMKTAGTNQETVLHILTMNIIKISYGR